MATTILAMPRASLPVRRLLRPQSARPIDLSRICRRCLSVQEQRREQRVPEDTSRPATPDSVDSILYGKHEAESRGSKLPRFLERDELFSQRHIGPSPSEEAEMVKALDPPARDLDDFISQTLPSDIRSKRALRLQDCFDKDNALGKHEHGIERELQALANKNEAWRSFIGAGYYDTNTPGVIQRNVLENPAWYTSYTPYQAEISQGRLESLLNFQTLVTDLTSLSIANASVLDEGTAAAEAMTLSMNALPTSRLKKPGKVYVVSDRVHPQTIAVLDSRARGFGINIVVGDVLENDCQLAKDQGDNLIGVLAQYPDTTGGVHDFQGLSDAVHKAGGTFCVATDLLALTLLKAPGEFGADVAFGNSQRFGVPLGFGGPHAAFFACSEKHKRKIPGRLVGVSKDRLGKRALRLALQTREQHIRREKATSNICTAQALLANMSAFYAIYHGPQGLKNIALRIWSIAKFAQRVLEQKGYKIVTQGVREDGAVLFDTITVQTRSENDHTDILKRAKRRSLFVRQDVPGSSADQPLLSFSFDETTTSKGLADLLECFGVENTEYLEALYGSEIVPKANDNTLPPSLERKTPFLTHSVFNQHHSETELLRYIHHLQSKDLSLVHSMIPLGSCTMKLNATTEMLPVSYFGFSKLHPFAPIQNAQGYVSLVSRLSKALTSITGMQDVSLQPNSGAQGEFAGLRVIKKYLDNKDSSKKRDICLIPVSAHGTNPASAAMAGMKVVPLKCDTKTGNLDIEDLKAKCEKYKDELAAIMVTYPSTFGVFEPGVKEVCQIVHDHGGQVYMDGANLNAQIGLCSPGEIGADVCHLNLHKTFCIPHGGGGPGVGPIAVKEHLKPFLPSHPHVDPHSSTTDRSTTAISPVSSAPWGSASILPISYAYIQLMGSKGLKHGTEIALLNANYIMSRLRPHYPILYTNDNKRCAHEFILDARGFKETSGIEAIDIAKRLQDYGFHAPTMSWPVANTLMIEPTESESKEELDRFCDALIEIRKEIKAIEDGNVPKEGNVLKMSPHPQADLMRDDWDRPYTREQAAYPLPWLREKKFWPSVARVDDAYGDTNLFCTCTPVEGYEEEGLTGHQAPMPT
ncbi:glycine decarboxylase subunit P [Elasticomyces elasticus]|uniref:Glycine cleavage system P protein n=1 Tax=Exophiala sideris TaxID=1016849 RepID=A0ABR0J1F9_9EURO|nr:glycine decarboxylase subunit P [Elasticomyces elasticus]KAK5024347.1 glycine decarboxylase subunit P [Exophiala sideris]KAK5030971.1 glycine decarboxylase subunit P [Exophiala sideris]KAK5054080.1 glycine decarboxylase subunit P [Exophiala sideris]KAK5179564.1 glycine decarboxylase subunit P [Eurotiomycetes sp. CCFEE 6388]